MRMTIMALAILNLAACGGGGGGGSSSFIDGPSNFGADIASIQTLTGSAPPAETLAQLNARLLELVESFDSLFASTNYGNTDSSDLPTFIAPSSCTMTSCRWMEANSGISLSVALSDIRPPLAGEMIVAGEMIGTKHGITLRRNIGSDYWHLSSWLNHSTFYVRAVWFTQEDVRVSNRHGLAGGDGTGSQPAANATWQGLMVGTTATGAGRGNRLQGDATLTYDSNTQMLGASFTNIQNIDRLQAHSVSTISFTGVPVDAQGEFEQVSAGNRIQGGLYGAGHAEAAGVFEQMNIVGAFGAKKQ